MAKAPADTVKYNIYADITIDGVVEKPDVVGALFGQSEGLLGEELELRDLQKTGRIGRIEVDIKTKSGKSQGKILVPSSLDMVETSIIAATIEMVDRVGPCNANIKVTNVVDARTSKRKSMVDRAKIILKKLMQDEIPESMELVDEVRKSVQLSEITTYRGLSAGPAVEDSDSVILVEGRADVLNLLKCGIKNAVAIGGTNIPRAISELSKSKTSIAFVDGDRGGDIILNELRQVADIDFVAKAPSGKEVEDLGKKEVIMALRKKVTTDQAKNGRGRKNGAAADGESLLPELSKVKGKLSARLYGADKKMITEIEIKDLISTLGKVQPAYVVLDGIITQRLVDSAHGSGVKVLIGVNTAADIKNKHNISLLTEKAAAG
ncbi:MAG: DNA primase [Candidatus Altiarchaeales archaeon]|nr:DNA primase [Candidatus Altiarchaeales archaeon]MBD3416749.1 DNA primase [Candidatus Altiarchaeales archaeon]